MIECKHFASSTHSGLHLVDDQHNAVLVADTAKFPDERCRSRNVTALALDDFENDACNLFGWRSGHE